MITGVPIGRSTEAAQETRNDLRDLGARSAFTVRRMASPGDPVQGRPRQPARPALAASTDHDIELWVQATPEDDEVALSLEGWTVRAPAGPRLAAILGGGTDAETGGVRNEWAADEELRIISLSPDLAQLLGVDADEVAGQPLTR